MSRYLFIMLALIFSSNLAFAQVCNLTEIAKDGTKTNVYSVNLDDPTVRTVDTHMLPTGVYLFYSINETSKVITLTLTAPNSTQAETSGQYPMLKLHNVQPWGQNSVQSFPDYEFICGN